MYLNLDKDNRILSASYKNIDGSVGVLNSAKNPPNKPLITQAQAEEIIKDNEEVI